jgi:hypothetical protein
VGDDSGVTGLTHQVDRRRKVTELKVHGLFVAIGHKPNTGIFEGQLDMHNGYIKTKTGLEGMATATSDPGRVRRRRRAGPHLPPGHHQRRHRLHGRTGRAALPGRHRK